MTNKLTVLLSLARMRIDWDIPLNHIFDLKSFAQDASVHLVEWDDVKIDNWN